MKEIWRDIEGYEGLYKVSNYGDILNLKSGTNMYGRFNKLKILKPVNAHGYLKITLSNNGEIKQILVHILVARAFPEICGEWFEGAVVNHKDECKSNNVATNLEVCSQAYNCQYGTSSKRIAEKNTNGKLAKAVLQYTKEGVFIKEYPSLNEVQRQKGFATSNICCAIYGKGQKTAYGFIWKYKD